MELKLLPSLLPLGQLLLLIELYGIETSVAEVANFAVIELLIELYGIET